MNRQQIVNHFIFRFHISFQILFKPVDNDELVLQIVLTLLLVLLLLFKQPNILINIVNLFLRITNNQNINLLEPSYQPTFNINLVHKKDLIIIIILYLFQLLINLTNSQFLDQLLFERILEITNRTDNHDHKFLIFLITVVIILDMVQQYFSTDIFVIDIDFPLFIIDR